MPCLWLYRLAVPVVRNDACVAACLVWRYTGSIFDASTVLGSTFAFCAEIPKDEMVVDNCGGIFGGIYNKDVFAISRC